MAMSRADIKGLAAQIVAVKPCVTPFWGIASIREGNSSKSDVLHVNRHEKEFWNECTVPAGSGDDDWP